MQFEAASMFPSKQQGYYKADSLYHAVYGIQIVYIFILHYN